MPESTESLNKQSLRIAEEFIYGSISPVFAIKVADRLMDDKNRPGKKFMQWTLRTKDGVQTLRKPSKFGLDNRTPNGSVFDIKLLEGKIVWIGKSVRNPLDEDWIKKLEGEIKLRTDRNGKTYSILSDVYIGLKLLNGIQDGDKVKIIALQQKDGRWSAISIKKL